MGASAEIQNDLFFTATVNGEVIASDRPDLNFLIEQAVSNILIQMNEDTVFQVNSSAGKDSQVLVMVTLAAAVRYKQMTGKSFPIRIVTSNTRVENPLLYKVVEHAKNTTLAFSKDLGLDVDYYFAEPNMLERALVSTIGSRTIFSANGMASKCQSELKGNPLARIRSKIRKEFKGKTIINFTGVRFDESARRAQNLKDRGERHDVPVANEKQNGELFMAPIADWLDSDVFEFLDRATADDLPIPTYDNLIKLVALYELTGMEVCATAAGDGVSSTDEMTCGGKPGRLGWQCQKVSDDHSMKSALLVHDYLEPLYDFNRLIRSGMLVSEHRAWIGRKIHDDGTVLVSGVAHSLEWCQTLFKAAVSIQANEEDWAYENGTEMRFALLITMEECLSIAYQWHRYHGVRWSDAVNIYNEIMANPLARYSKPEIDHIINTNNQNQKPLSFFGEARGRYQMVDPSKVDNRLKDMGLYDAIGEITGVLGEGTAYTDSQGRMHSPLGHEPSFSVGLGDEPPLAWSMISIFASEGNDDVFFLTRNEYIKFAKGYQRGMATSLEYAYLLREHNLVNLAHDIDAITKMDKFIPDKKGAEAHGQMDMIEVIDATVN